MTKYEMLSDDDLIRLSRMGDRNAEEFLLDSYRPMILHMTRQLHLQHINEPPTIQHSCLVVINQIFWRQLK